MKNFKKKIMFLVLFFVAVSSISFIGLNFAACNELQKIARFNENFVEPSSGRPSKSYPEIFYRYCHVT